jgi:hypothetical protein
MDGESDVKDPSNMGESHGVYEEKGQGRMGEKGQGRMGESDWEDQSRMDESDWVSEEKGQSNGLSLEKGDLQRSPSDETNHGDDLHHLSNVAVTHKRDSYEMDRYTESYYNAPINESPISLSGFIFNINDDGELEIMPRPPIQATEATVDVLTPNLQSPEIMPRPQPTTLNKSVIRKQQQWNSGLKSSSYERPPWNSSTKPITRLGGGTRKRAYKSKIHKKTKGRKNKMIITRKNSNNKIKRYTR